MALSTVEAEYVTVAFCYSQLLWIKQQLNDYGIHLGYISIMCDNTSLVDMAKNSIWHKKIKHIDVRNHFLKDCTEKMLIKMMHCRINEQIADIFIKVLRREYFKKNRLVLGLINQFL